MTDSSIPLPSISLPSIPTIGLEALNEQAALQTRIDRKYILHKEQAAELLEKFVTAPTPQQAGSTPSIQVLEIDGIQNQRYRSLYFDTPELTSYWMAATGRRKRFKIRTRVYQDTNQAFVELKVRGARGTTVKDRLAIPVETAMQNQIGAEGEQWLQSALQLAGMQHVCEQLQPSLWGTYTRTTLLVDDGRVTIDTNLTWQNRTRYQHLYPNMVIVETKAARGASRFDRMLWDAHVRPARISKFGTGTAALDRSLAANKWHRTLQQHFTSAVVQTA